MKINHPPATLTLTSVELALAVERYLKQREPLPEGLRLGNLVGTHFTEISAIGQTRTYLSGQITFELLPESQS